MGCGEMSKRRREMRWFCEDCGFKGNTLQTVLHRVLHPTHSTLKAWRPWDTEVFSTRELSGGEEERLYYECKKCGSLMLEETMRREDADYVTIRCPNCGDKFILEHRRQERRR